MSLRLFYGHEPVVLPLAALSHIEGAPKGAVTVLMTLAVDTTLSVEERQIGGLGIYLVRELMDSINYEREDGKNILTLIKRV